jgi:hypothetical protein
VFVFLRLQGESFIRSSARALCYTYTYSNTNAFLILQEGKQAAVENVNRLNQTSKVGDGSQEALQRGFTAEQSATQFSNFMYDAAFSALQGAALQATTNVAFSKDGTKVTIDVANASTAFHDNMAKSIGENFYPQSGHGALVQSFRDLVGKPTSKIRKVDNTMSDTREVTGSTSRQELNRLATTERGRAFVASDAAPLLSLHPEAGLSAPAPAAAAAAVTPANGMMWPSSDALSASNPQQNNDGYLEGLYQLIQTEAIAESNVLKVENIDTVRSKNRLTVPPGNFSSG